MKNITNRLCAYFFILALVSGLPLSALVINSEKYTQSSLWPQKYKELVNGAVSSKFDGLYKNAFPLKEFSVSFLNTFSYLVFHEARKGAIVGQDGWIYTDEEFLWTSSSAGNVEKHLGYIDQVGDILASHGIRLAIVLLPQKAVVYPEYLGAARLPDQQQQLYSFVRQRLHASRKAILPDVGAALLSGKSDHDMFMKTDTHWTVAGANAVAIAVANSIPKELLGRQKEFKRIVTTTRIHHGDLLRFVDLGSWKTLLPVQNEAILPVTATNVEANVDDFLVTSDQGTADTDIVLLGTSYSANSLWSFQSQLELALGIDVVNRADEGKGFVSPMKKFLLSGDDKLQNVKLVIWEIPVRYLAVGEASSSGVASNL